MCEHTKDLGGREAAMTVIQRDSDGRPTVWCDPCLAPIIAALNEAGVRTKASCCGHGDYPGWIMLSDGRDIVIYPDHESNLAANQPELLASMRSAEEWGEPSDAMIDAALKAWGHYKWVGLPATNQVAMRAALRAALRAASAVTESAQGVTIPEHLNKTEELRPAIRKLLVDEARAENLRRKAENARTARAAVTEQGENR